jgi:hypothetical protein
MGADYSFYVKTIETLARAFLPLNILAIRRVLWTVVYRLEQGCQNLEGAGEGLPTFPDFDRSFNPISTRKG